MKIALHDSEKNNYPNLVMMKLSAWHKKQGDTVEWFNPMVGGYDKVYSSKVFTWTREDPYLPKETIRGGTGYGLSTVLPEEIEHIMPDYSLYNCKESYGFLTRGCPNNCPWCFVPKKEGGIRGNADVTEFLQHKFVVFMDNNVLACDHGLKQIGKLAKMTVKVDFNQGLDARLIDNGVAKLLANLKWFKPLRLACDKMSQMKSVEKATKLLRANNCTPKRYFIYTLINDIDESLERINFLKGLNLDPFGQPYRDKVNTPPTLEQKQLARWVNMKSVFRSCTFEEYKQSRGARV